MTSTLPESLLAEIIGVASDAVVCVDGDQRIIFFNEGAVGLFGYTVEEVVGKPLELLIPARARADHHRQVEEFIASPMTARRMGERQEIAGRRKNGEEFPAEGAITKLKSGDEVFASVMLRDVSARKRREARQRFLVETSEDLAASLELGDTLRVLARLWVPRFADLAIAEMARPSESIHIRAGLGVSGQVEDSGVIRAAAPRRNPVEDRAEAEPVAEVPVATAVASIPPRYRQAVLHLAPDQALVVTLSHHGERLGRVTLFGRDRAHLDAEDRLLAEDLARRGAMALENARLHDETQRALRIRDDTVSVVSHDLRNPVNAVKMLAGAVLQPGRPERLPEEVTDQVRVIQSAAQQMDALIQDLLDMSRAEAGRFEVDTEKVPADALLRNALRTLAPLAADKGVSIDTDWPGSLPEVLVDPERIVQVVSNVVGNAIKFTPTGGKICIAVTEQPDALVVSVSDTGPGISPQHLPHVFDRYWQSSRRNRGAGLGLPIAKAIIEAHDGRIWAESTEGKGATFHFTLPR